MFAPNEAYHLPEQYEVIVFDVRDLAAVEQLHHLRARWQGETDIEALDADHYVLVRRLSNDSRGWAA
jgi:hypothetical protein